MEKDMTWIVLSEYSKDGRDAKIYDTDEGYVVELMEDSKPVEVRNLTNYSLRYAEDCAENWVEGII